MNLAQDQYNLVPKLITRNLKTVIVDSSGLIVTLSPSTDSVSAFLQGWFPKQEVAYSIAKVLTGDVNPPGRLPFSSPRCYPHLHSGVYFQHRPSCGLSLRITGGIALRGTEPTSCQRGQGV
jgi:hypothetical protein